MFEIRERTKSAIRTCLTIIAISGIAGGLFGLFQLGFQSSYFLRGALTGALISSPIVIFEVFYVRGRRGRWLRETQVWLIFLIRTGVYTIATLMGEFLSRLPFSDSSVAALLAFDSVFLNTIVFTSAVAAVINFILLTNQLLGKNVLFNLLAGRYHQPHEEVRIFLFADMVGSTTIAEELGNEQFLKLLNRCFFNITEPVLHHGGEIYRYVGDEIIVTWKAGDKAANSRAIECASAISEAITAEREEIKREFGIGPTFRMALHAGPVMAGEIGDFKREITFLGDVVNTTARIEQACSDLDHSILVSDDLVNMTDAASNKKLEHLGGIRLRGKAEPVELYALVT